MSFSYSQSDGRSLGLNITSKLTQKLSLNTSCVLIILCLVTNPGVTIKTRPLQIPNGAIDTSPLLPVPVGSTTKASPLSFEEK